MSSAPAATSPSTASPVPGRPAPPRDGEERRRPWLAVAIALAAREGQRSPIEILWAPTQDGGVEGDHERPGPAVLGAGDEVVDQRLVCRPVQLEPVSGVLA